MSLTICRHSVCTCPCAEGTDYCSDFCAQHPEAEECHCHHVSCSAPHHH